MKKHFKSYYRPDPGVFEKLWKKCIFVFDTSVLLDLYRYSKKTREELFQLFQKISDCIWIPHHVALEYQRNRLKVIDEMKKLPVEVEKAFKAATNLLNSEFGKLGLNKPHSRMDVGPTMESIDTAAKNLCAQLEKLITDDNVEYDSDQIRDRLDNILEDCVGDAESEEELNQWYKDGETRYKRKIPPGFEDQPKEEPGENRDALGHNLFQFNGRIYKRKFGDLVIWHQIMKKFCEKEDSHMIFITSDNKEDWWCRIHGKTIGPRRELMEEIGATPENFYIYHIDQFLSYAVKYLGAEISQESISQVREVYEFKRRPAETPVSGRRVMDLLAYWLLAKYPMDKILIGLGPDRPHIIKTDNKQGIRKGYYVIYMNELRVPILSSRVRRAINHFIDVEEREIVVVSPSDSVLKSIRHIFARGKYDSVIKGISIQFFLADFDDANHILGLHDIANDSN